MNYIIQLTNKKTGQIITKEVNDLNDGEKLYFKFSLDMREFEDGEYDLELTESGQLILTDILYIGDYQPNSLQYKRGDNTFIEIVLDAKFQDKEVEITEIETVVKTDEEYDGFKEVIIDATPLYENAYEIGNKDGYETGIKIQKELLETLTVTENGTYTKEDGYNEVIVNVPDLNGDYDTGYEDGFVDGKEEQKSLLTDITINKNGTYTKEDGYNKITVDVGANKAIPNGFTFRDSTYSGELPASMWLENDWSNFYNCNDLFYNCSNITGLGIEDFNTIGLIPYNTCAMFLGCNNLQQIPIMDTSNVTEFREMFKNCYLLTTIPELDTSKAITTEGMFSNCKKLTTILQFDLTNVINSSYMFSECHNLETISVTNIDNIISMSFMFSYCFALKEVTMTGNPSKIEYGQNIFIGAPSIIFKYDDRYDYSKIIELLPAGSTAIPITV